MTTQRIEIQISPEIRVTVESADAKELIRRAVLWSELPKLCPICQASLSFMYRTPKDFEYFGLKCNGPVTHVNSFGESKKEAIGLFYKANNWTKSLIGSGSDAEPDGEFTGGRQEDNSPGGGPPPSTVPPPDDDMPF